MSSYSDQPGSGTTPGVSTVTYGDYVAGSWTQFAGIMVVVTGFFNIFDGLVGFFRSAYYIGRPVYGDLWIWALLWLAFGVLEVLAGYAILSGRSWGRWFGIVVVSLNALLSLTAVATYPFWVLTIVAFDVLVLYGLTAGWRRPAGA
jgi:hypothetical protein